MAALQRLPDPYDYSLHGGGGYTYSTSASTATNYTSGTATFTELGPYEECRPRTNRERLAAEVDKVCALARK